MWCGAVQTRLIDRSISILRWGPRVLPTPTDIVEDAPTASPPYLKLNHTMVYTLRVLNDGFIYLFTSAINHNNWSAANIVTDVTET